MDRRQGQADDELPERHQVPDPDHADRHRQQQQAVAHVQDLERAEPPEGHGHQHGDPAGRARGPQDRGGPEQAAGLPLLQQRGGGRRQGVDHRDDLRARQGPLEEAVLLELPGDGRRHGRRNRDADAGGARGWRSVRDELRELRRRRPAADRHRLVVRAGRDPAQAALRPLGAQPLRVDDALARPDRVDAVARVERLHRGGRGDPHEEDRVAVVLAGLVAEALRPVGDDGPELGGGQDRTAMSSLWSLNAFGSAASISRLIRSGLCLELRITLPLAMYVTTSS